MMPSGPYRDALLRERFSPWPLPREAKPHGPLISEWGLECGRGFVSSERFARSSTERVIPRTNRAKQKRQWNEAKRWAT